MRRHAAAVIAAVLATACQRGEDPSAQGTPAVQPHPQDLRPATPTPAPSPPVPVQIAPADEAAAYARDIDRICRVEELSSANADPGVNPVLVTAQWLQANLETRAANDWLITRFNRVADAERGPLLDAEATRVGLSRCPTARRYDPK